MRTTVDLPPGVHRRALELARARGVSLSATLADLTLRGLGQLDEPPSTGTDPVSGLACLTIGRPVTAAEVAAFLDEE